MKNLREYPFPNSSVHVMIIQSFLSQAEFFCPVFPNKENKGSDTLYSIVSTAIVHGINSVPVYVEADVADGMPVFEMVGFLAAEVKEARERVRTALKNSGYMLPAKRITINLSPAYVRKSGSSFDLPIAVAVLSAMGIVPRESVEGILIVGEIGLNGQIQPVHGVLSLVSKAAEDGMKGCIVPLANKAEALLITGIAVTAVSELEEVIAVLNGGALQEYRESGGFCEKEKKQMDFAEINGQRFVKRACEVAVSGRHNFLMVGPPGAGKSMIAQRIPTILPPMSKEERLELSQIYSVCGLFDEKGALLMERPFRSPHHTIPPTGLSGGGRIPKPGEISLAHKGVLFLDELTEFKRETLEVLRQPLEEQRVHLVRVNGTYDFPADFMLVCAMNPCRCGYYPDRNRCSCTPAMVEQYRRRVSLPLLDRIDICVEAKEVAYQELVEDKAVNESSETIQTRVAMAYERQKERFKGTDIAYNSRIPAAAIKKYCKLNEQQNRYMEQVYQSLHLTARTYHKLLKVARTIADLEQKEELEMKHLEEAVCYRNIDRRFWEGELYGRE